MMLRASRTDQFYNASYRRKKSKETGRFSGNPARKLMGSTALANASYRDLISCRAERNALDFCLMTQKKRKLSFFLSFFLKLSCDIDDIAVGRYSKTRQFFASASFDRSIATPIHISRVNVLAPSQFPTGLEQIASLGDGSLGRHDGRGDVVFMQNKSPQGLVPPQSSVGCVGIPKGRTQLAIPCIVGIVGWLVDGWLVHSFERCIG